MTISTTTLKNAAFAIEHDLWTDPQSGANYLVKDGAILRRWEPEHDDGDSFELMVSVGVDVENYLGCQYVHASDYYGEFVVAIDHTDNRMHDYRRAILECAAAIGAAL